MAERERYYEVGKLTMAPYITVTQFQPYITDELNFEYMVKWILQNFCIVFFFFIAHWTTLELY